MKKIIPFLYLFFVSFSGSLFAQNSKVEILKKQLQTNQPQQTFTIPLQDEEAFREKQRQEKDVGRTLWAPSADLVFDFASIQPQVDPVTGEIYRLIAIRVNHNQLATTSIYFDEFDLNGDDQLTIFANIEGEKNLMFKKTLDKANNSDKGKYSYGFINIYQPTFYLKLTGTNSTVKIERLGYVFKTTDASVGVDGWDDNFNSSQDCIKEENVNCPQYDYWCDEKRSVFKMCLINGIGDTYLCTGSLVNNERYDGMPIGLTAKHCVIDGIVNAQTIFMFNYESPNCDNINGPINNTVCGSTLLENHDETDYAILGLTDAIPKEYDVFFAGWTNSDFSGDDDNPSSGAGIHHPNGDIKKIMTFNEKIKKRKVVQRFVWLVKANTGGLENGSSGSPLFQENKKRLIGQLSRVIVGDGCSKSWHGRFYKSWHDFGLSGRLNPNGDHSGNEQHYISEMGGFDPCVPNYNFTNANNLHTSDGVTFLDYAGTAPRKHNGIYVTSGSLKASQNVQIQNNTYVEFDAGTSVQLNPGFQALNGSHFLAHVDGCDPECGRPVGTKSSPPSDIDVKVFEGRVVENDEDPYHEINDDDYENYDDSREFQSGEETSEGTILFVYPNPAISEFTIEFTDETIKKLEIYSSKGFLLEERVISKDNLSYTFSTYNEKAFILIKAINESDIIIQKVLIKP